MKRTITTTYDIDYHSWSDEAEVAAALNKYPFLEWAAIAVYRAKGRVFGDAILRASALIDAVNPAKPDDSFDLPTMVALLADPIIFKPEGLAQLKSVIPEIFEDQTIWVKADRRRLMVVISLAIPGSTETIDVYFTHASKYAGAAIIGLPFPLHITVRLMSKPSYFGDRRLRFGGGMVVSSSEDFKRTRIQSWIAAAILNALNQ